MSCSPRQRISGAFEVSPSPALDHLQTGMVSPKGVEEAFGSVTFAVVLAGPVLPQDGFGHEGNDFTEVGVDENSSEELMVVGDDALGGATLQTVRAVDLLGREVAGAIKREQIMVIVEQ